MFNKLKQFKQLRDRAKTIQQTLANESAEGSAGWGKVKIKMDGNQKVMAVTITPEAMQDRTKLEEMVKEAGNDAIQKIQKIMSSKLKEVGGLDLAAEFGEAIKK
jgi:hypothetical protein